MYLNEYESELVHAYIVLPFARKVLERDLKIITSSKYFKIKEPYISLIENKLLELSYKLRDIKKEMHRIKMYVDGVDRNEKSVKYVVRYKGYTKELNFENIVIRNHTRTVIEKLFKNELD